MKIWKLMAIYSLMAACATPAWAGNDPAAPAPASPPEGNVEQLVVGRDLINRVAQYLQHTAVLYSVKCTENPNHWFCESDRLLVQLQQGAKPLENKPASEKKKDSKK